MGGYKYLQQAYTSTCSSLSILSLVLLARGVTLNRV